MATGLLIRISPMMVIFHHILTRQIMILSLGQLDQMMSTVSSFGQRKVVIFVLGLMLQVQVILILGQKAPVIIMIGHIAPVILIVRQVIKLGQAAPVILILGQKGTLIL